MLEMGLYIIKETLPVRQLRPHLSDKSGALCFMHFKDLKSFSTQLMGHKWKCQRHLTTENWHVTHGVGGGWTFSQNFSSLALTVWVYWCCEDMEEKGQSINKSVTATLGLLITKGPTWQILLIWEFCLAVHMWKRCI